MERQILQRSRALSRSLQISSHCPINLQSSILAAPRQPRRCLHTTRPSLMKSQPPKTRDRGPKSDEDTQTDFSALDVLRNTIAPATSIDACTSDGFALNNQVRISGSGIMLIGGEAFRWWPWTAGGGASSGKMEGRLLNAKGQWEVKQEGWGVLELVYPKPGTFKMACKSGADHILQTYSSSALGRL
jgi:NADH dehydrogenase [ubiquinone] 1 alpha subcomplex assembly factor 3